MYHLFKKIYLLFKSVYRKTNRIYWTWRATMACARYTPPLKAAFHCKFSKNTYLGKNTSFNGFEVTGNGRVQIGDNFHCGKNCKIITSFHNYMGTKLPYDETNIDKEVIIEDNVWLGIDIIILGGVTIGEGSIIQAGSVVSKSIPKLAIAGGNPAQPFKYRDEKHYYDLKASGKFI
jgi:chloramphenicol O-acetyltransferase type B